MSQKGIKLITDRREFPRRVLIALALVFSASASNAQTSGKEILERKIQSKLDRILTADEYLLDIKVQSPGVRGNASASEESFLPGLQVLGPSPENLGDAQITLPGKADVLLIVDKKVSRERARVSHDIVNRIVEAEGLKSIVKVSIQQKDINKIPPPDVPQPPVHEPSALEQLIREKDFVSRALLVFWGGIVSLMALYFVLRRFVLGGPDSSRSEEPRNYRSQAENAGAGSNPNAASTKPAKTERTREELYSKDEAILNGIKEITDEAKEQPGKVARILSRWVSQNADLGRVAALFLRNCDIKTIESICKAMHPSDLEAIISHKIEDFEPFGSENQRVIERMRADFAVMASEHILRERPDPLGFMKRLSDDELQNILAGESELTIAMVATQIPAHRMQKLYENTSADEMKSIVAKLTTIKLESIRDFDSVQVRLKNKMETIAGSFVREADRVNAIHHMVGSVASPRLQCDLMARLVEDSRDVYSKVRENLLVATDLRFLPGRVKTLLVQSIDADTVGTALSVFTISFDSFIDGLPAAYRAVFNDAHDRKYDDAVVMAAWKKVSGVLNELITSGLMSRSEVAATIRRADSYVEDAVDGDNIQVDEDLNGAA